MAVRRAALSQPSVDILQVSERIDPMPIAGLGQREQLCRRFPCRLVTEEEPRLPPEDRILERAFRRVVVHRDRA